MMQDTLVFYNRLEIILLRASYFFTLKFFPFHSLRFCTLRSQSFHATSLFIVNTRRYEFYDRPVINYTTEGLIN